jgi:dihydroorotate dehydrogenase (NAD+) catalytic subunit
VSLANPIMTASGTAGHGDELGAYVDLSSLGAVVVKSVSSEPWAGNPAPRLLSLGGAGGMLNSVGLHNLGIDEWLAKELPALTKARAAVVVSIWGFTAAAYRKAAAAIATAVGAGDRFTESIVAVEANISCPNVEDRRNMFAHSVGGVSEAVEAAVSGLSGARPLWAKLSPNVTDLPAMASAALAAGAEGLTLINTVMGMAIDPATGRPRLGGGGGGLSGPAIHPVAVRAVFDVRAAFPDAAIIGVGGVMTGEDAVELVMAGADAVQVGTATFRDPRAPHRVLSEMERWCARHGVRRVSELKGVAHG